MLCQFAALHLLAAAGALGAEKQDFLARYKGIPYGDGRYYRGAQKIPGKVMCAYYDGGGEGVAYHDSEARNNGSGVLNPAEAYVQKIIDRRPCVNQTQLKGKNIIPSSVNDKIANLIAKQPPKPPK